MIHFTKMHGLGNDYIFINRLNDTNIIANDKIQSLTRFITDRHFGIGADGVIFIEKSKIADFKMSIFNKDGSEAQMCGNGIRCFAKYVFENKLTNKKIINIETKSGIKQAYLQFDRGIISEITICMGKPVFGKIKNIKIDNINFEVNTISIGNPHSVIFIDNIEKFNVKKYGAIIEQDKNSQEKNNVEFVEIVDKGYIKMRVWERGTGETLACGTGACAALAICANKGYTRRNAIIGLPGGNLRILWNSKDNNIYMTGIATTVFDGKIDLKNG